MKSSSKSLPVKLVNKGDFLIPISNNEKTDSMLNCDMTRIQKTILNKYITNPLKNKNESRFKHLFHKNQTEDEENEEESLKNVIFNLNYGRNKEKLKTVSPSLYLSPDLDLSNTNLIRHYSSKENKSILEFDNIPEDEDLFNNQLSIIKEEVYGKGSLISLANEDDNPQKSHENNGVNENLHENKKVNRITPESKDMNEMIFKRSNSSNDDDENNEEVSIKDYKKYLSQEIFFNKKFNTSVIPSKTNENNLVSKDNFPTINLDSYMIKGGSKPGSNFNTGNLLSLQSNECSTMTFSISIEQIITLMLNPVLQEEFLYEVQNNHMRIISLIQLIKSELEVVLSYDESVLFLYNVYIIYKKAKQNEKDDRNLFFDIIDIYRYACMTEGLVLLKLLINIITSTDSKNEKIVGSVDIEYVYSSFNSINQWNNLIFNKYGKNYIEFFLKSNLFQSTHKSNQLNSYNLLFSFLNTSFISFSKMNYSTFVIQIYVEHHHEVESFEIIKNNILELSSCRNGIFVLLAGVKGYKSNQLTDLLLTILSKLDILCNDIYASTLMEYIFKTHTSISANYLISHKLNCLFPIIENQYGNFIIQKLISIIEEGETKRRLINEIKKIIPYLKRQNIKKKWLNIVINAESAELKGAELNEQVKSVFNKKEVMKNESNLNDNEYINSKSSKNTKNSKANSIYSSMESVQKKFSNLNMNVKENVNSK